MEYFRVDFYPRPPRGGRPKFKYPKQPDLEISIHALREEGDLGASSTTSAGGNFYPRPPRGGRRRGYTTTTLPEIISIHALREEGDGKTERQQLCHRYFYPRPPRGGRPGIRPVLSALRYFYPRPPRGGRQQKQRQNLYFQTNYTTFCTNLEEL